MGATALLVLIVMNLPGADPEPSELVRQLGSESFDRRVEAVEALERLGAEALPALRGAWDDEDPRIRRRASREADEAEVRARASEVLDRIEGGLLTRPSLVSLDFDGVPLEEAVRVLSKRSGHALTLDPEAGTDLGRRRVRLLGPGPVPFWEALGLLGRAGHVRHDPSAHYRDTGREAPITLVDG